MWLLSVDMTWIYSCPKSATAALWLFPVSFWALKAYFRLQYSAKYCSSDKKWRANKEFQPTFHDKHMRRINLSVTDSDSTYISKDHQIKGPAYKVHVLLLKILVNKLQYFNWYLTTLQNSSPFLFFPSIHMASLLPILGRQFSFNSLHLCL